MQAKSKQERSFPFRHAAHISENRKDPNKKRGSSKGARAVETGERTCDWKSTFRETTEACSTDDLRVCQLQCNKRHEMSVKG